MMKLQDRSEFDELNRVPHICDMLLAAVTIPFATTDSPLENASSQVICPTTTLIRQH